MSVTAHVPKREISRGIVTSSNIASIGYDAPSEQLAVEFKNGHVFHYFGVTADLAQQLDAAESKGRFYVTHIKGRFEAERMTGLCPACADIGWVNTTCTDCGTKLYAEMERRDER
jgi:ribosomal protein L33